MCPLVPACLTLSLYSSSGRQHSACSLKPAPEEFTQTTTANILYAMTHTTHTLTNYLHPVLCNKVYVTALHKLEYSLQGVTLVGRPPFMVRYHQIVHCNKA